jgi:hypothetical protein
MNPFQQKLLDFLREWSQGRPLRRVHSLKEKETHAWWKCGSRLTRLNNKAVDALARDGHVRVVGSILTLVNKEQGNDA